MKSRAADLAAFREAQVEGLRDLDDDWQPPDSLHAGWRVEERYEDGASYTCMTGLTVFVTRSRELDGRRWVHVSVAHPTRMPKYRELCSVKSWALGDAVKAVEVHAPSREHVNLHVYCRHLWHCLDGDPLPDFSRGLGTI